MSRWLVFHPPRKLRGLRVLAALGVAGIAATALGQAEPVAFVGARLITIDGPEIDRGTLVVHEGRIVAVGSEVSLPDGMERVDAAGRVIMPGLICTHSHIGGTGGGDRSGPIQPGVRVMDSINVRDAGFRRAVAGGLTTLNIMPGSGHLSSGQTVYVKLRGGRAAGETPAPPARTIEDILYLDEQGRPMGGLKMANGTNPMRDPPFPGTRAKAAALVRQRFLDAQDLARRIERAAGDPDKAPARDLDLEALIDAMEGTRIVHHHTHRADDIITVLRLAEEFGFRVVLHHVSEGWKVAEEIAAAGVPCSIILVDSPGGKLEALNLVFKTGAVLEEAGVNVAFHTDDWITDSRLFLRMGALGVRAGMSRDGALRALTLAGAEMLDLEDRIGSLTVGKDADFIVLDGDPFSVYTKVLETWVEGRRVFDRDDPEDLLFAVGGYGAGRDQATYLCCFEHEGDH